VAPSAIKVDQFPETPAELDEKEIARIVAAFGAAARRAKEWGFDGIQLHGAHGYLLNQFFSPLTNRREDRYGGSLEGRTRFAREVVGAVRAAVGATFPVMIKLNASDHLPGGLEVDEALQIARILEQAGIDAMEISAGTGASGKRGPARERIKTREDEAYHLEYARRFKAALACPVMVVGGFRSLEVAEAAIEKQGLDFVALSRPLIREPGLPNRWRSGDRERARCISCNGCFKPGLAEGGIYCVQAAKEAKARRKG
jgi:2,4-dienoyl-CoA reductase-like NADH-dependent reductase (Old Yellow Enzyme family)